MVDGFKEFVNNIGVMCEMWMVTYQKFVEMGLDNNTAIEHTKAFTSAIISASRDNGDTNGA